MGLVGSGGCEVAGDLLFDVPDSLEMGVILDPLPDVSVVEELLGVQPVDNVLSLIIIYRG